MSLHVGIDCRFASEYAGLGTYTRELTAALLRRQDKILYTLFVRSLDGQWLRDLPRRPRAIVHAPFSHYSFGEQLRFPGLIKYSGIDLLFSPQFNVPFVSAVPFVCTVHDLILHKYPNNAGLLKRMAYRFLMRSSLQRAQSVVTVSDTTKRDIRDMYGQAIDDKTQVIYPGIHERFSSVPDGEPRSVVARYGIGGRFVLYVGGAKQHKNVQRLIDAFERLNPPGCELALVISGKEKEGLRTGPAVRIVSDVDDADLPALYSCAAGFATASLYEGFGLPPVEAMACGCPVLVSNRGSLPEATGGHAIVAEPTVEGMTEGLRELLMSEPQERAIEWGRHFSWDTAAAQVSQLFRSGDSQISV